MSLPDTEAGSTLDSALDDRIAQDIHTGRLSPGAWLKQIDLEMRYGAERPAVRSALDALSKRRLVEHIPNRGYRVAEFTSRQIREIFYVRSVLEKVAAELIIENATDQAIETAAKQLIKEARKFETSMAEGLLSEQIAAARRFHIEFLNLCPNQELVELILDMRDRIPASLMRAWRSRERMSKSIEQHYKMVDALEARDVDLLKAVLTEHIMGNSPPLD